MGRFGKPVSVPGLIGLGLVTLAVIALLMSAGPRVSAMVTPGVVIIAAVYTVVQDRRTSPGARGVRFPCP